MWTHWLARFGMIVRGALFFVSGALALRLALGQQHSSMTQLGAIQMIGMQPAGRVMLIFVAVGLAGYSMWGVIRGFLDPMGRGHHPIGIFQRLGYLTSALAYAALLLATVQYLTGMLAHVEARDWTAELLARPFGATIVVVVGLCWIFGAGVMQVVQGWKGSFERDLDLAHMGSTERQWARALGRIGMVSRGLVFIVIGILLIASARHATPHADVGMDGALMQLLNRPYGRVLLGAAGLGLMAFGCFSGLCARWLRIPSSAPGSPPLPHRSTQ